MTHEVLHARLFPSRLTESTILALCPRLGREGRLHHVLHPRGLEEEIDASPNHAPTFCALQVLRDS